METLFPIHTSCDMTLGRSHDQLTSDGTAWSDTELSLDLTLRRSNKTMQTQKVADLHLPQSAV